ncbi:hypothetical protein H0A34_05465 [Providencia rettgeri]|uniref:hypothetical protein n=1 Tax=Providencia rettgeri TaxID=587 RepID=UPI0015D54FFB|nr:hypothetical protein [Providencia rettgeri]QLI96507.1 hypothetical protein H0A34_05465 [Providencia rettgeri]
MEFKHSPAPWNSYIKYLDYTIVRDANDKKITFLSHGCSEADANLITAAPELLEALQSLVTVSGLLLGNTCQTELTKARLAIAKALGQQ